MRGHAALVLGSALVSFVLASPIAAQEKIPALELPHYMGVQIGGSGYFQIAGRVRVSGPLVLELGGLYFVMGGSAVNGSAGLSLDYPLPYVSPFVSAGVGGGVACGEDDLEEDSETGELAESEPYWHCTGTGFGYTRAGVNLAVDRERTLMISIDGGFWHGTIGSTGDSNRLFLWPMIGVGFYMRVLVI